MSESFPHRVSLSLRLRVNLFRSVSASVRCVILFQVDAGALC